VAQILLARPSGTWLHRQIVELVLLVLLILAVAWVAHRKSEGFEIPVEREEEE